MPRSDLWEVLAQDVNSQGITFMRGTGVCVRGYERDEAKKHALEVFAGVDPAMIDVVYVVHIDNRSPARWTEAQVAEMKARPRLGTPPLSATFHGLDAVEMTQQDEHGHLICRCPDCSKMHKQPLALTEVLDQLAAAARGCRQTASEYNRCSLCFGMGWTDIVHKKDCSSALTLRKYGRKVSIDGDA